MKKLMISFLLVFMVWITPCFAITLEEATKNINYYVIIVQDRGVSPIAFEGRIMDVVTTKNGKEILFRYSDYGEFKYMTIELKDIASITRI